MDDTLKIKLMQEELEKAIREYRPPSGAPVWSWQKDVGTYTLELEKVLKKYLTINL